MDLYKSALWAHPMHRVFRVLFWNRVFCVLHSLSPLRTLCWLSFPLNLLCLLSSVTWLCLLRFHTYSFTTSFFFRLLLLCFHSLSFRSRCFFVWLWVSLSFLLCPSHSCVALGFGTSSWTGGGVRVCVDSGTIVLGIGFVIGSYYCSGAFFECLTESDCCVSTVVGFGSCHYFHGTSLRVLAAVYGTNGPLCPWGAMMTSELGIGQSTVSHLVNIGFMGLPLWTPLSCSLSTSPVKYP